MSFLPLFLSLASIPGPVEYTLNLAKDRYAVGDVVRVELRAKNVSKSPVILMKAVWDGSPAASANARLFRQDRFVEAFGGSSMPTVQVMVDNKVGKDRFLKVLPDQTVVLFWQNFEGELDFGDSKTRDKEALAKAVERKLTAGTYECKATYAFEPDKIAEDYELSWNMRLQFGPEAESLWKHAVRGKVSLTQSFRIGK